MSRDALIQLENITAGYGRQLVIQKFSLTVHRGEVVGCLGPNGAGKTTLLKVLAGLLRPGSGTVRYLGTPLHRWSSLELARHIAFVAQRQTVYFPFSVEEVVMMGRVPHQRHRYFDNQEDWRAVRQAMELTDIGHLEGRFFNDLSGGEQQLVLLASALAQDPKVLLLDEPTSFLDLKHQLQILQILRRLRREKNTTLIMVTHDLRLAETFCKRLVLLKDGMKAADLAGEDGEVKLPADLIASVFEVDAALLPEGRIRISYPGDHQVL